MWTFRSPSVPDLHLKFVLYRACVRQELAIRFPLVFLYREFSVIFSSYIDLEIEINKCSGDIFSDAQRYGRRFREKHESL